MSRPTRRARSEATARTRPLRLPNALDGPRRSHNASPIAFADQFQPAGDLTPILETLLDAVAGHVGNARDGLRACGRGHAQQNQADEIAILRRAV